MCCEQNLCTRAGLEVPPFRCCSELAGRTGSSEPLLGASCCALAAGTSVVLLVKEEDAPKCVVMVITKALFQTGGLSGFVTLNRCLCMLQ